MMKRRKEAVELEATIRRNQNEFEAKIHGYMLKSAPTEAIQKPLLSEAEMIAAQRRTEEFLCQKRREMNGQ